MRVGLVVADRDPLARRDVVKGTTDWLEVTGTSIHDDAFFVTLLRR